MKKIIAIFVLTMLVSMSFASEVYYLAEEGDTFARLTRGTRNNIPERLHALLEGLKKSDKELKNSFDDLGGLIHKSWYLNSEFEADRNVMLGIYRVVLEEFSNLNDRLTALELELFNPEELGFNEMYSSLDSAIVAMGRSYKAMEAGKSGLRDAKKYFGESKAEYAKLTKSLGYVTATVSGAVPYEPAPAPAPTPAPAPAPSQPTINYNDIVVHVYDDKADPRDFDTVKADSYEGKLVLKKSKENLHELSSIDRLMFKEAIKGKDGFSFFIAKLAKNDYAVYWWHLGDDINDLVETLEDIFN